MRPDLEGDFEGFVAAVSDKLFRTAYAITRDHQLAEDAVQSALASAYAKWRRVSRVDQPEAYVRRMVVNEVLGWRRRRSSWSGRSAMRRNGWGTRRRRTGSSTPTLSGPR